MTTAHATESWRPVVGHPGYEVSDLGRVRSVDREVHCISRHGTPHKRRYKGALLKLWRDPKFGYFSAVMGRGVNSRPVHQLVAEAFIGPRPEGQEVRHLNSDGGDNRLCNLAYGTRSDNNRDSTKNKKRGHPFRKVVRVRAMYESGVPLRSIVSATGLSRSTVCSWLYGDVRRSA